jgi:hypothetical protein
VYLAIGYYLLLYQGAKYRQFLEETVYLMMGTRGCK